ncbi:helix-turn-helix domain-containing protein [Rhodanobacter aciditrophus]|uniref:Helix-turn-helix domain-containing protein n=1 Tax=Rhodanobacter aciditrophus TaxID=1623218 RepID=A0ABW4AY03_9GAMM
MQIRDVHLPNHCHSHSHDFHQIIFHTHDEALFDINGCRDTMNMHKGCIIPTTDKHCYKGYGDSRQVIIDLPILNFHTRVDTLFDKPCYFKSDQNLIDLVRCIKNEQDNFEHFPEAHLNISMGLLASLYCRIYGSAPNTTFFKRLNIELIERFVEHHLAAKISVAQLADMNHMSRGHFNELFTKQTGLSPYQFILKKRLTVAHELIVSTRKPLSLIAQNVGFSSQSALTHAFTKHFGYAPRQLRTVSC